MLTRQYLGASLSLRSRLGVLVIVLAEMCAANYASAESLQSAPMIFDVRINLPLEPDEPTHHDFYLNAGNESGFKKGMFLTVVRPVPVHDPVQNKQQGTLNINVARLQVIHVERGITVARLHSEFTNEERPTLEFESVMIGDRIDPASLTMEAPNLKKKKSKSAEIRGEMKREIPAKTEGKVEAEAAAADSGPAAPVSAPAPGSSGSQPGPAIQTIPIGPAKSTENASPPPNRPDMVRAPVTANEATQTL